MKKRIPKQEWSKEEIMDMVAAGVFRALTNMWTTGQQRVGKWIIFWFLKKIFQTIVYIVFVLVVLDKFPNIVNDFHKLLSK